MDSALGAVRLQTAAAARALLPAAADEVSAGISQLFSQHAEDFHKAAAWASAYH
ncbi:PE domain-containing protein [Mycobacterium camsae]|uniref:PE domain-containing protein n=1 Tax=Mycobacterium gordonae TaxID=1778 RepID=UPI0019809C54